MVGVDFSVWSVICFERGAFGKGGARHFGWRCLPRVDGNRRGGRSANFDFCVQRARVVLENILSHHAYRLGGRVEKCGVKIVEYAAANGRLDVEVDEVYLLNSPNISLNSCGIIDNILSTIGCGISL